MHYRTTAIGLIVMLAGLLAGQPTLAAAPGAESAAATERDVNYRGKPPFKRRLVSTRRAHDAVRSIASTRAVRPTGVAVRGRPPFKRQLTPDAPAPVDNAVFARLEEASGSTKRVRRRGPPGKRAPFVVR